MIDTPCESIISTAVEEYFSTENRHSGIFVNDEALKYHQTLLKPSNKLKLLKNVYQMYLT